MKLMILDGNSIVNRAFYGIRMLNAPDGTPTNGIYGFLSILQKLLAEEEPDSLCVAFDLAAPTFRHRRFEGYKAQRKGMPEELAVQMPILRQVLDAMGVMRLELEGYEADDLIGTVSRRCSDGGWDCVIVTGDKDSFQLINDRVTVKHVRSRMGQTETTDYTPGRFEQEYGFQPRGMVDLKALMGDSSDNIPGVAGIGEKTALELIRRFGSLDGVYENIDSTDIKPGVRKKLLAGEDSARLSFELATIVTDAPLDFSPEQARFEAKYGPEVYDIFTRLGFARFIEKWGVSDGGNTAGTGQGHKSCPRLSVTPAQLRRAVQDAQFTAVSVPEDTLALEICNGENVYTLSPSAPEPEKREFVSWLFSGGNELAAHNVKDLMVKLLDEGLPCEGFCFDTALAAYLIEPTANGYGLETISSRYCGDKMSGAEAIFFLRAPLESELEKQGMDRLLRDLELPLCRVLADMERTGFLIDRQRLSEYGQGLQKGIEQLERSIYEMAGEEFNINSTRQLSAILFEKLMLPAGKKTRTGWSTNAEVLESLRGKHPIIEQILDYRMLAKLKSTYADGLLKVIAPDGRVHTKFQMTVTATGRLSSAEPNLQNIPVRRELGSEIRRMFVAPEGSVLVDADYSQIELRILAHISGDEAMRQAFLDGGDIHTVTASQVFGVPPEEVTATQRSRAKAVNFGIIYGISAFSLAQDIKVSQAEAREYINAYLDRYSGVREYMKRVVERAKEDGYAATQFGRRRPLPELKSSNYNVRSFGERVAMNMPIQGTAADVIKLAMINVHRRLREECPEAKLVLQVHDELIVECPEKEASRVCDILVGEMQSAVSFSVPLTVEVHSGRSWFDAK